jgi:hypothetical protein
MPELTVEQVDELANQALSLKMAAGDFRNRFRHIDSGAARRSTNSWHGTWKQSGSPVSAKRRDSARLLVCASPASCSTVTCVCSLVCVHSSKRESQGWASSPQAYQ